MIFSKGTRQMGETHWEDDFHDRRLSQAISSLG